MKYKAGDKVRVRSDLKDNRRYGSCIYVEAGYREMIVTIKEVKDGYYRIKEDGNSWHWTDEMFDPIDEMSAEEAIKTLTEMCNTNQCSTCPVSIKIGGASCYKFRMENPEGALEVLKQWKADHEKKLIETEFRWVIRVIEDTGTGKRCVYEERLPKDVVDLGTPQSEILKKYCAEHEGKFFTTREKICVVKE